MTRMSPFARFAVAVLVVVTIFAACDRPPDGGPSSDNGLPEWVSSVQPEPGQRSADIAVVEVEYPQLNDGENIRLEVDGVDVTSSADFGRDENIGGPGKLVYDPQQANLVPLGPGGHTATVHRVRLPEPGAQHQVLDSYTWSFTIQ